MAGYRDEHDAARGDHMSHDQLIIAANTSWVVIAATLVLFMQAGFALLEAGLTRAKNAAHVAAKNAVSFSVCAIVFWLVGFGIAFGDKAGGVGGGVNKLVGTSGFAPSAHDLLAVGSAPFSFFSRIPAGAGWFFEVVFAAVACAIVWGGMAERAKLSVYIAFGALFTVAYSVVAHWVWSPSGWLFQRGMQDFAGSTVVHFQGALAALAGTLLLGPRIGRFDREKADRVTAGHNLPLAVIGALVLWLGWMGFNPGSTLGVETGGNGFFAYVALVTNLGAAAGLVGGMVASRLVYGRVDVAMLLNGVLAALVAITAACGFVAPWAALVIGFVAGAIGVAGIPMVARLKVDDPIGAIPVHGVAGIWGTLATGIFAMPSMASKLATGEGGLLYTGSFHQLGVQALGIVVVGLFSFGTSFAILFVLRATVGIRVSERVELEGLDLGEHGVAAYPELSAVARAFDGVQSTPPAKSPSRPLLPQVDGAGEPVAG
jgi:Amt family ammonium transporter